MTSTSEPTAAARRAAALNPLSTRRFWQAPPRTSSALAVPVIDLLEARDHPHAAEVDLVGARVVADVVRVPDPVREVREALLAGAEQVRDARPRGTRDHVAGPHRSLLLVVEHEHPAAVEHH